MKSTNSPFPHRRTLVSIAVAVAVGQYGAALAAPAGQQVVAGQVTVTRPDVLQTVINQASQSAIVNWQSFSIGAGERVDIRQPSASSVLLNRVIGNNPSEIYGRLSANGQVFLVNPNGVLFGRNAQVSVGGLVASTLDIANDDFLSGRFRFAGNSTAAVDNQGHLQAAERGTVALLGGHVNNDGTISAQLGTAALVAGEKIALDFEGDGLTKIRVDQGAVAAMVANRGMIIADGGQAVLSASAAQALADTVLNQQGVVRARSLVERDGKIVLDGGANGVTLNSGTLDAGGGALQKGGTVNVLGHYVGLVGNAAIDASGGAGGGAIFVGGGAQGGNPLLHHAAATFAGPQATLRADALGTGDGGTVVLWSDGATRMFGAASATGGAQGGNGGFIETSGKFLDVGGARIGAAAAHGKPGTWLLDPYDVNIVASPPSTPMQTSPDFVSDASVSDLWNVAITSALDAGTSVSVTTGAGGSAFGDINVQADIIKSAGGNATLTLNAARDINVAGGVQISANPTGGRLSVDFNADADGVGGGAITMNPGAAIATNGGNVRFYGQGDPLGGFATASTLVNPYGVFLSGAAINTTEAATGAGGSVSLRGQGVQFGGASPISAIGVALANATITSDSGPIAIAGVGGDGGIGVYLGGGSQVTTTAGGTIDLRGRGGATLFASPSSQVNSEGLYIADSSVSTSGAPGDISLSGEALSTTMNGINVMISSLGGGQTSGTITLRAPANPAIGNTLRLNGSTIQTSGVLNVLAGGVTATGALAEAPATGIRLYQGTQMGNDVLMVSMDELQASIQPGLSALVVGSSANTGAITVDAPASMGAAYNVTLQNGGAGSGGINILNGFAIPGQQLTLSSGGPVTQGGPISADSLLLHGTQPQSSFQLAGPGNDVNNVSVRFDQPAGSGATDGVVNFASNNSFYVTALTGLGIDGGTRQVQSIDASTAILAGNTTLSAGGDLFVDQHVSSIAADATLSLNAGTDIFVFSDDAIGSIAGKLNVDMNADADSTGGGGIRLNAGASILSNGGNVRLYGQGDPVNGFASGSSNESTTGVALDGATIDTTAALPSGAGGNIVIRGMGWAGFGTGVTLYNGALTASSGSIGVTGIGRLSGDGVNMLGPTISTTGGGAIDIRGLSQPDLINNLYGTGVYGDDPVIFTSGGPGSIVLSGESTGYNGMYLGGGSIGNSGTTGDISLRAFNAPGGSLQDTMLVLPSVIDTTGVVGLRPGGVSDTGALTAKDNVTINVNALVNAAPPPGEFSVNQQGLQFALQPSVAGLVIGSNTHTGAINVSTSGTFGDRFDLTFQNGGLGSAGIHLLTGLDVTGRQLTLSSGGKVDQFGPVLADAVLLHGTQQASSLILDDSGNTANFLSVRFDVPRGTNAGEGDINFNNATSLEMHALSGVGFDSATNLKQAIAATDSVVTGDMAVQANGDLRVAQSITMQDKSAILDLVASNDIAIDGALVMAGDNASANLTAGRDIGLAGTLTANGANAVANFTAARDINAAGAIGMNGAGAHASLSASNDVNHTGVIAMGGPNAVLALQGAHDVNAAGTITMLGDGASLNLGANNLLAASGNILASGANTAVVLASLGNDVLLTGNVTMSGPLNTLLLQAARDVSAAGVVSMGSGGFTVDAGRDLALSGDFSTAGGTGVNMVSAKRDILLTSGANFHSNAAGPLNLDFNADADSLNGGAIAMSGTASIASNGGNVRLYGQGDAAAGFASGSSAFRPDGIAISGASIATGSGALTMRGQGRTFVATGPLPIGDGVRMSGATVSAGSGAIAITGIGGDGGSGVTLAATQLHTSAGGAIELRGRSGAASGPSLGDGLNLTDSAVYTSGGAADIALSGEGLGGSGINLAGSNAIGNAGTSGNIILRALNTPSATTPLPMLSLGGTIQSTGIVNMRPGGVTAAGALTESPATAINVGGAGAPGQFTLSQAALDAAIRAGTAGVVIGSAAQSGAIGVSASGSFSGLYDLTLQNDGAASGGISLYNGVSIPGRMLTLSTGGSVTQGAAIVAGRLLLHGTQPQSNFQLANAGNAVGRVSARFEVPKSTASPAYGDVNFFSTGNLEIGPLTGRGFDGTSNQAQSFAAANAVIAGDLVAQAGGNMTLQQNVSTLGSDITLVAGGVLLNPVNATLTPGGGGWWRVFADTWTGEVAGGLAGTAPTPNFYNCLYGAACMSLLPAANNYFVYRQQPVLSLTLDTPVQSRVYGTANPAFPFSASGLVKGDTLAASAAGGYAIPAAADVGSYAVTGTFTSPVGYLVNAAPGTLNVTPATLTYVATPASRNAGQPNPAFGGSVTGLVNGDTLAAAATGTLSFTSTAPAATPAGQYAISGSGLSAKNYVFQQSPANLTALTVNPLLLLTMPSIAHDVSMPSSDLYGANYGTQRSCVGSGPLAGASGAGTANDTLALEWSRVRETPNLSNCIGLTQRYSCGDF